jgi:UDP-N-acetylglucosamine--N-acetylmuramyl-(pentapeptide) pyrophosphoryl-undecaprenol N-acetylglucosamine transferase
MKRKKISRKALWQFKQVPMPEEGNGKKYRIIVAGGGTGGHIFPAIAIANALKKMQPATEILFIGAKGKMEMEKVPQAGYSIEGIDIAGFNRSSLIKNIGLPFKLLKSFQQVKKLVNSFSPDAMVGVGGYSSFPVLRYGQAKRIPTFIHESNSFAGKSNILLGTKATEIFVAADGMEKFFPASKLMITGNPVRRNIAENNISREEGIRHFGLNPELKTVLVTGGSLGAKGINEAIAAHIDEFSDHHIQLIWQTGKPFAHIARQVSAEEENIRTSDFIPQMEFAFAAADLVVSRSGAMSVAEICVSKKPAIFVPFPFAAEDHQTANAKKLVEKKAGILVRDDEAKEKLVPEIISLLKDEHRQEELKKNIEALAIADADEKIAGEILNTLAKNRSAE